jgi:hypothetical protein
MLQKDYVDQVLEAHIDEILGDMRSIGINEPVLMEDGNPSYGLNTSINPTAR